MTEKYKYAQLTWPEIKEKTERQAVILLPFGIVEDHGPHLPLDTDDIIVEAVCTETARRMKGETLVMPLVAYGFDDHHMDFPGAVHPGAAGLVAAHE